MEPNENLFLAHPSLMVDLQILLHVGHCYHHSYSPSDLAMLVVEIVGIGAVLGMSQLSMLEIIHFVNVKADPNI
jgi:uncharacterized protein (DUF697 family)